MEDRRDPVARCCDTEFGRKIRTTTGEFGSIPGLQRPLLGHCSFARDGSLGIHTSITRGAAVVRK
jgi:hypothetical protein